jgi:hypothetical protein
MRALDATGQRTAFTDSLRPPSGYGLEACIGTTYSLDFDAFTAILLAFVGAEIEEPEHDPPAVMTALAGLRHRLRAYVNAGSVHAPATSHRLFGLYDRVIRSVFLPGAAFHPKVWVLKFAPLPRPELKHAPPLYRLLCASRNATASRCWELGVTLNGQLDSKKNACGTELEAFCQQIVRTDRRVPSAVWKLIGELPRVQFESGREGADELRFDWQWPRKRTLDAVIPTHAQRAILISPFVRGRFIDKLCARVERLVVVSTQSELDLLPESAHERLTKAEVFVVSGHGDDEVREMDLHAKLLVWESGADREMLLGSANATGSAWGIGGVTNCEAMVAMRPGQCVADVYRAFVSPEKGKWYGWIEPYVRNADLPDAEEQAEKDLEQLWRTLAGDRLVADYKESSQTITLRCLAKSSREPLPAHLLVDVVPLLQRATEPWQPYAQLAKGARFHNVSPDNLSACVLVRFRDSRFETIELQFCTQAILELDERAMDARDDAINARLLENVDARALLLNVLQGRPVGTSITPTGSGSGAAARSLLERVSIERVLEVCTSDPSRIHQVDAVLRACRTVEELAGFRHFWATLQAALVEESQRV